jgi:hypothetical protein
MNYGPRWAATNYQKKKAKRMGPCGATILEVEICQQSKVGEAIADLAHHYVPLLVTRYDSARSFCVA